MQKFFGCHVNRLPERSGAGIVEDLRAEDDAPILVVCHTKRRGGRGLHGFLRFADKGVHLALVHAEKLGVLGVFGTVSRVSLFDSGEDHLLLQRFAGVVGLPHRLIDFFLNRGVKALEML